MFLKVYFNIVYFIFFWILPPFRCVWRRSVFKRIVATNLQLRDNLKFYHDLLLSFNLSHCTQHLDKYLHWNALWTTSCSASSGQQYVVHYLFLHSLFVVFLCFCQRNHNLNPSKKRPEYKYNIPLGGYLPKPGATYAVSLSLSLSLSLSVHRLVGRISVYPCIRIRVSVYPGERQSK